MGMKLNQDQLKELAALFAAEAEEHLHAINQHLLALEKQPDPTQSAPTIAAIFRVAHTLKGSAHAVEQDEVATLAHHLETLFDGVRKGEAQLHAELFDIAYQTLDGLSALVTAAKAGTENNVDVEMLQARLQAIALPAVPPMPAISSSPPLSNSTQTLIAKARANLSSAPSPSRGLAPSGHTAALSQGKPASGNGNPVAQSAVTTPTTRLPNHPTTSSPLGDIPPNHPTTSSPLRDIPPNPSQTAGEARDEFVRVSTTKLDALLAQVGELQVTRIGADQRLGETRRLLERVESWETQWRKMRTHYRKLLLNADTIYQGNGAKNAATNTALTFGGMRELSALLEFLETSETSLRDTRVQLGDLRHQLEADSRRMTLVTKDLQDDVRRTRMMPAATVFDTFPRLVRDLAHDLEKEVQLVIEGGETEVDRSVLEQLKSPLMHLLRNSVDHGIEPADARVEAGKPPTGTVALRATQRGSNIVIEVSDDGAGINLVHVKACAIKKGFVTADAAATLSDREALWLIFNSGMTTHTMITDISGRGVGLDVVRENVERLQGVLDVTTELGQGTRFTLSLPLTVATTLCLLTRAQGQTFALPIHNITRIVPVPVNAIGRAQGRESIQVDGRPVVLARLGDILALPANGQATQTKKSAIVLGSAEKRAAFLVDGLLDIQEIVIKSLPRPFLRLRHAAGATILGTGEVVLILHVSDLLRSVGRTPARVAPEAQAAEAAVKGPTTILVADDSITTRTMEKNILEAAGYRVRVASDGLEAWTLLQADACALLVSDIQMPRMDGFELVSKLRADERFKHLPTILVTSLASREDRERGVAVGADAYIAKTAFDQDSLLATIQRLI